MGVRKRVDNLQGQLEHALLRRRFFGDYIAERPPLDILHDDEAAVAVVRDFVDCADVGVIERRGRPGLTENSPADVELVRGIDELDGDGALQSRVEGAIDDAHAAGAEDAFDFIVSEAVVRSERRHSSLPAARAAHAGGSNSHGWSTITEFSIWLPVVTSRIKQYCTRIMGKRTPLVMEGSILLAPYVAAACFRGGEMYKVAEVSLISYENEL